MVVGAGIAGLAIAANLERAGASVLVLEAGKRPGGKVSGASVAGHDLDAGTDAWLDRDGAMERLVAWAGLTSDIVAPAAAGVWLWDGDRLVRMPEKTVLGIPTDPRALREWLGAVSAARAAAELYLPSDPVTEDVSVGEFVSRRFGRNVATELVDPLLGGVYAGHVDQLSLQLAIPLVAEVAAAGGSVTRALRARPPGGPPPFRSLAGGLHRLPTAIADRLGASLRFGATAAGVRADDGGWMVRLADGVEVSASNLVLATPAPVTAELVRTLDADVAAMAREVRWASVGVVLLAYPPEVAGDLPEGSGMLVPRSAGRFVKAATWVTSKWGRDVGEEPLLLRASVGRNDDERFLSMSDDEVVEHVTSDLEDAVGIADPVDAVVVRWPRSLPQYVVGHAARVAVVRDRLDAVAPGLTVAGASWDGVGIGPIASAAEAHAAAILGRVAG